MNVKCAKADNCLNVQAALSFLHKKISCFDKVNTLVDGSFTQPGSCPAHLAVTETIDVDMTSCTCIDICIHNLAS